MDLPPNGSSGGSGDVVGPSSATDNAFARFDGTTGKLIQNSTAATLSDTGAVTCKGLTVNSDVFTFTVAASNGVPSANAYYLGDGQSEWGSGGFTMESATVYKWRVGFGSADVGIARDSSGVLRVTDGSTGRGALLAASLNLGGATVTDILTATASLDFGSIASQESAELSLTVTGAALGDCVILGLPNASASFQLVFEGRVSSTDTVTIKAVNATVSAIDADAGTFRATVLKF